MSIYNYNSNTVAEQLTPPILRSSKFLAWLYVLVNPIQNLWSRIFEDYTAGNPYTVYDVLTTYNFGDRVVYTNKSVYEATYLVDGVATSFSGFDCLNGTYWTLVNDIYIGADERIKYNAQIILLEYALNKYYECDSGSDQIYIENNANISSVFVMGNDSIYSSTMPNDSIYSETYMGNNPTFPNVSYDYVVWFPNATWLLLGNNYDNRLNNIKNFVNKYNLSGLKYIIDTY